MMYNTRFSWLLSSFCILLITIIFVQCNKEDTVPPIDHLPPVIETGSTVSYTNINATITDEMGVPLGGVIIESSGQTAITNNFGFFALSNVTVYDGRVKVKARKEGYFNTFYATKEQGTTTKVRMVMATKENVTTIESSVATTIDATTAAVDLPANGYIDDNGNAYNGVIDVAVRHFDPSEERFELLMPGGDFRGETTDGEEKLLISYGAMSVELTAPDGTELNLAEGQTAEIRLQVPSELLAAAPSTIPLWHFNENTLIWEEESSATLVGNEYIGTVSHFSTWNCDDPVDPKTFVNGYVVDCNGGPLADIAVTVGPLVVYTNEFGFYETNTAVDLSFSISVSPSYNYGLSGNTLQIDGIAEGEVVTVDNIVLPCPAYIEGVVQDCDGNAVSANVFASWSTGGNVVYTEDGSFNLITVGGETITLTAVSSDLLTGETTVTSVAEVTTTLSSPLQVCDEIGDCPLVTFEVDATPYAVPGVLSYYAETGDSDYLYSYGPYIDIFIPVAESLPQYVVISATDTIAFYLSMPLTVGTYEIANYYGGTGGVYLTDVVGVAYNPMGAISSGTSFVLNSGTLVITEVNATEFQGTFEGNGFNMHNGNTHTITNGYFCIPIE